ncbi:MAG: ComF family protein [Nitrospinota bacterium]
MIKISPKQIKGQWDDGFALDFHTVSSDFVGYDEYGQKCFDTKRTAIGELLYKLKYGKDQTVVEEIATTAADFVKSKSWLIDLVTAVPPSSRRQFQPVIVLAKRLAEVLRIAFCNDCITKTKNTPALKNVFDFQKRKDILDGVFQVNYNKAKGKNVLLVDDLYRSGATMNEVSSELHSAGKASKIFALTITKTSEHR